MIHSALAVRTGWLWLLRARQENSIGAAERSDPKNGDGFSDAERLPTIVERDARHHSREVFWRACCPAQNDSNTVNVPGKTRDPDVPDVLFHRLSCKREDRGKLHVMCAANCAMFGMVSAQEIDTLLVRAV